MDPWTLVHPCGPLDPWTLQPLELEPLELVDPWTLVDPWPLDRWIIGWILEGALCTYIYIYIYIHILNYISPSMGGW